MDPAKYEYQSEFARHFHARGREEGRVEGEAKGEVKGKAELLLKQLTLRFGAPSESTRARVLATSSVELDTFAERVLIASISTTFWLSLGPS